MKIKENLNMLGLSVVDKVTGFKGIVSSMSFDLYGCVQGLVTPSMKEDGKCPDNLWLDVDRLRIVCREPVMKRPDFELSSAPKGPAMKPVKF